MGGLGLIVIVALGLFFGIDPSQLLQGNLGDNIDTSEQCNPAYRRRVRGGAKSLCVRRVGRHVA